MHFADPDHLQVIPRSYVGTLPNGEPFRRLWQNHLQPFNAYFTDLIGFLSANGVNPLPSEADVQAQMCSRVPQGCVGASTVGQFVNADSPRPTGGCSSCGQRF